MSKRTLAARVEDGSFEALLAAAWIAIVFATGLKDPNPISAAVDLLAFSAAALVPRFPRFAGTVLGLALVAQMFVGPGGLAEYAPVIPILGTGLRRQRRLRLWMTVAYGLLLTIRIVQLTQGAPVDVAIGLLLWALLIGLAWAIGDAFASYRKAQQQAALATVQQHRVAMARELHDTVARELSRASLQVQVALAGSPTPELHRAVDHIHRAANDLRTMMRLLRDAPGSDLELGRTEVISSTLAEECERLRGLGFAVALDLDGDLAGAALSSAATAALASAIGEAGANIERHGAPGQPCRVTARLAADAVELSFANGVRHDRGAAVQVLSLGLVGLRERVENAGGSMSAQLEGDQWVTRVSVPV